LREVSTVLLAFGALIGAILLFRWVYVPNERREERVEARIVGFSGYLSRSIEFRNVVTASVRLRGGEVVRVRWPTSARASHCRAGDTVRLIRYSGRYSIWRDGCYPSPRDPNPPAF